MASRQYVFTSLLLWGLLLSGSARAADTSQQGTENRFMEGVRRELSGYNSALAADSNGFPTTAPVNAEAPALGLVVLRIVGYLIVLILCIIGLVWFLKRGGLARGAGTGGGAMDIIEVLALGQGGSLLLVRVQNSVYLISRTQNQINLLTKFEPQEAMEVLANTRGSVSIRSFKDAMGSFMNKLGRKE